MRYAALLLLVPFLLLAQNDANKEAFALGELIYKQTCVSCHGKDGQTNPQMMLVVKPRKFYKTILTQEQSFKIIKYGAHHWGAHSNMMPSFQHVYSDKQIQAVALYVSKKFNPQRDLKIKNLLKESKTSTLDRKISLVVGEKIFKKNCALCHGVTGDGKSEYVEKSRVHLNLIYPYNLTRTLLNKDQMFLYAKFGGH